MNSELPWIVIPARGGSRGIPRKNLRELGGKPLIAHAIKSSLEATSPERVWVITDDAEIAEVARRFGANVRLEDQTTPAEETLDQKIVRNLPFLREQGAASDHIILTFQPTSPLLRPDSLRRAAKAFDDPDVKSVLSLADDRHLRWGEDDAGHLVPQYVQRVNRQSLPAQYKETGGIIGARLADIDRLQTRVIVPVAPVILSEEEGLDIDSYSDLFIAQQMVSRMKIAIRVDAGVSLGMGHVYRMQALATELARHEIKVFLSVDMPLGIEFFERSPYDTVIVKDDAEFAAALRDFAPNLIFLDRLNSDASLISSLRDACPEAKIVTFEDAGNGAKLCDLVISEFVPAPSVLPTRQLSGTQYSLLAPSFETLKTTKGATPSEVSNLLILFGGTDPSHLGQRSLDALARIGYDKCVTVVRGMGATDVSTPVAARYKCEVLTDVTSMPLVMSAADAALTSAGRTVVELASVGLPSLCMAQNQKELTHTHADAEHGVWNLGLGDELSDAELDHALEVFLSDYALREQLTVNAQGVSETRCNQDIVSAILRLVNLDHRL